MDETYNNSYICWKSGFIHAKHKGVKIHMNQIYDIRNSTKWYESFPA